MSALKGVWRYVRWPLAAILVIYLGVVIAGVRWPVSKEKSDEAVAAIHAQRLTMKDVDGSNLPPVPDPAKVDATIQGVDANDNGIRDDVELAIFKKYPNDLKIRAAELQYAMSLQMETSEIINTETFVAVSAQTDRGYACVTGTATLRDARKERVQEVEGFVYNTAARRDAREKLFKNFATSVTGTTDTPCDLNL